MLVLYRILQEIIFKYLLPTTLSQLMDGIFGINPENVSMVRFDLMGSGSAGGAGFTRAAVWLEAEVEVVHLLPLLT